VTAEVAVQADAIVDSNAAVVIGAERVGEAQGVCCRCTGMTVVMPEAEVDS
jgi:hypothetical protein